MILSQSDKNAVDLAAETLAAGGLVALPTETVYGLAGDATNGAAIQAIYTVKGRPAFNPLICHVSDQDMARNYVEIDPVSQRLMDYFWPGPLTFVLPQKPGHTCNTSVSAGLDSLAVRCPDNMFVRSVITKLGRPIAAPSANISGKISPTTAQHVQEGLGDTINLIIDGGPCPVGLESTIISVSSGHIILLRPGTIGVDEIAKISGLNVQDYKGKHISAPGQLSSHYAPETYLTLNYEEKTINNCFIIGFGDIECDINLSKTADLSEAASQLFSALRRADKSGKAMIAVTPIPNEGIGIALNDRLKRAAAPKKEGRHE